MISFLVMRKASLRSARNRLPPLTRAHFDALFDPTGTLLIGDPETVAEKILRVNESPGDISRLRFQMSVAALPHVKLIFFTPVSLFSTID